MSMAERIRAKLAAGLDPVALDIQDDSAKHAGHAGARPGGETHFDVYVVAAAFHGQSRVARQRMVYRLLSDEIADGVHAIAMTTLTPHEAQENG